MKKHIFALFTGLILAISLPVSGKEGKDFYFHPLFKKDFKKAKASSSSSKIRSFKALSIKQKGHQKKEVFINWQRLHWGTLYDLIRPLDRAEQQTEESEDVQNFTDELRRELKSFKKRYNLKIIWNPRQRLPNCPDATEAFLEYWDKGASQHPEGKISFASLPSPVPQTIQEGGGR